MKANLAGLAAAAALTATLQPLRAPMPTASARGSPTL